MCLAERGATRVCFEAVKPAGGGISPPTLGAAFRGGTSPAEVLKVGLQWGLTVKKTGFRTCRQNSLSGAVGRGRRTGQIFFCGASRRMEGPQNLLHLPRPADSSVNRLRVSPRACAFCVHLPPVSPWLTAAARRATPRRLQK